MTEPGKGREPGRRRGPDLEPVSVENQIRRLHLERIEMTPAGIERGELLATIPLAPQETTNVLQKEWSTTSDEFSSIVTDYLEQVSEKGVTEKSELADSSESQTKHDNQVDLSASVSGKYGFVSFAANSSIKLAPYSIMSSVTSFSNFKPRHSAQHPAHTRIATHGACVFALVRAKNFGSIPSRAIASGSLE